MTRLLIVNADDFGLTGAVSRGILRAHREGIVTSASLLAVAPAFEESVRLLSLAEGIGIGIHLAAVGEDPPLLPAGRIRSLVSEDGRFAPGWGAFVKRARGLRRPSGPAVWWLARRLARRADRQGLRRPERSEGFDESGHMSRTRLLRAIENIALSGACSAEIFVHPGEADDSDRGRYAWGYEWAGELAALIDPAARSAVVRAGFRLGTYRDLGSAAGG